MFDLAERFRIGRFGADAVENSDFRQPLQRLFPVWLQESDIEKVQECIERTILIKKMSEKLTKNNVDPPYQIVNFIDDNLLDLL